MTEESRQILNDRDQLAALLEGRTQGEAADELGCSIECLRGARRRHGLAIAPSKRPVPRAFSAVKLQAALQARERCVLGERVSRPYG